MPVVINNPEAFAKYIERVVQNSGMTYMEAVIDFCETRQIDTDQIAPFISDKIKRALQREGQALHLLPKDTAELPLDQLS